MIDADAVIARLRATDARSGGRREAWTETWREERERRDRYAAGLDARITVERDAFANTWYRLPGRRPETVLLGSHSDCVPGGGWLDGILGLEAALGVLGSVAAAGTPQRTLAVVDWADEEGTRFGRSLFGSSAATGALTRAELDALRAGDGTPAAEVVAPYGFDPDALGEPSPGLGEVVAALELHIEQGPRLQAQGRAVAAVSGCLGVRRRRLTVTGTAGHAGALPMADRHDPVRAAARLVAELCDDAERADGLATAGEIACDPALITAVAARCTVGLDLRHAHLAVLERLDARLRELAAESRCPIAVTDVYDADPVPFDAALVAAAAEAAGGGEPLVSGPLHDSASLARAGLPAAMLFVASIDGISHARGEDSTPGDLTAGIEAYARLAEDALRDPAAA